MISRTLMHHMADQVPSVYTTESHLDDALTSTHYYFWVKRELLMQYYSSSANNDGKCMWNNVNETPHLEPTTLGFRCS